MDAITLNLRVGRTPAASAPTGGELSAAELDANFTNLKTAAEQLDSEKLAASDATTVTATKASPVDDDDLVMRDSENSNQFVLVTKSQFLAAVNAAISALADRVNMLEGGSTAPAAFTAGQWTSTAGDGQIVVNITALPSDGGSAITELAYTLNGSTWVAFAGTGTGSRTITGLTNDTAYPVQIRATNAIGDGAASDTKSTTPVAASGGGLAFVQQPAKVEGFGTSVSRSLTAVGSGNGLIVSVRCPTSAGTPTISDSAGGSWSAAVHSYGETTNSTTSYYYIRNNVTSGLTSVTATFGGGVECCIGVVEASGGTLTLDATLGATFGTTTDPWDMPFTSTADDAILVGMASFSNSTTVNDVAPLDADATAEYFGYFRGLFPTAGSNTAQLDLVDGRQGAYSGIVVKGV